MAVVAWKTAIDPSLLPHRRSPTPPAAPCTPLSTGQGAKRIEQRKVSKESRGGAWLCCAAGQLPRNLTAKGGRSGTCPTCYDSRNGLRIQDPCRGPGHHGCRDLRTLDLGQHAPGVGILDQAPD